MEGGFVGVGGVKVGRVGGRLGVRVGVGVGVRGGEKVFCEVGFYEIFRGCVGVVGKLYVFRGSMGFGA